MSCVCEGCGVRACGAVVNGLCEDCRDLGIVPQGLESGADRPQAVVEADAKASRFAEPQEFTG